MPINRAFLLQFGYAADIKRSLVVNVQILAKANNYSVPYSFYHLELKDFQCFDIYAILTNIVQP